MPQEVQSESPSGYGLTASAVREAITVLASRDTHPALAGYLVYLYGARKAGSLTGIKAEPKKFFDNFYRLAGASDKHPYYLPFGKPELNSRFYHSNPAGSYAPSSIRPVSPLSGLLTTEGSGKSAVINLRADHASVALSSMLGGVPAPGIALAAYLYRDHLFLSDGEPAGVDLYARFREDFGFAFGQHGLGITDVFSDDASALTSQLFEAVEQ